VKLDKPLIFPFSVGTTPVTLALGVAIFGFLGGGPVFFGSLLPGWMTVVLGLLTAMWFFGLVALPFTFRNHRASDLVVDEQAVTVRSGRRHARVLAWPQLLHTRCVRFSDRSHPRAWRLALADDVVATTEEPSEGESWTALADSLRTLAGGFANAATAAPLPPVAMNVLHCPSCGAPVTLSDDEHTRCRFCGGVVTIPAPLRAALADANRLAASRTRTRAILVELQRWRRARSINLLLAVALALLALSWPVMAVFTSEYFQYHDALRWRDVVQLFCSTMAVSVGLLLLVQSQLVMRAAFALVAATFHARPPEQPGWPPGCRHCGAPLAVTPEVPLVVCPYCRTDNVMLGVLLPHTVAVQVQQQESLDETLARRQRARRRWQLGFAIALLLMALGGHVIVSAVARVRAAHLPWHPPVDRPWRYEPAWVTH
jgi:DNA-directed RNA polymerase subunit RPC12/RpoP